MGKFILSKLQAAVFTPDFNITNSLNLANIINTLLPGKLDGDVSILPIPQDAPAEIPRLQLSSADGIWKVSISLVRTDLIYLDPNPSEDKVITETGFTNIASKFFCEYKDKINIRVQRLAFVTDRILREENPSLYVANKFCKEELLHERRPFNNVKSFEIHSLKKYEWRNFNINSWVRVKTASLNINKEPVVLFQNDLNTFGIEEDPKRTFETSEISDYFSNIPGHLKDILEKYTF